MHPHAHPDATWRKSSFSTNNGDCVEVADLSCGDVAVRDSKDSEGAVLVFSTAEWRAFVLAVRNGEFG